MLGVTLPRDREHPGCHVHTRGPCAPRSRRPGDDPGPATDVQYAHPGLDPGSVEQRLGHVRGDLAGYAVVGARPLAPGTLLEALERTTAAGVLARRSGHRAPRIGRGFSATLRRVSLRAVQPDGRSPTQ